MQYVKSPVSTICIGQAASMGSFLLAAGEKGHRFSLPNARIMVHQPSAGFQGQATDIQIHANEISYVKKRLNEIYSKHTGKDIKSIQEALERDKFMSPEEAKDFGIDVIDVRIKRADLPSANSEAIFKRMQTERTREAKEFRAQGFEVGQTIKSIADKEVAIILADARKTAQITRGEGDGLRNKIFADAFGRDPEFFSFYRAMQSYEKSLISGSETSLVLSPDSEFFRYFGESGLKKVLKK